MRVNPLFWVHLQLVSGLRNVLLVSGLYIAVFVGGSLLVYRTSGPTAPFAPIAAGALGIVTLSQGLFLLLLGPGAVHKALQRDFQSGMMESHRIAPLSGPRIAIGYLTGGHVQAGGLYLASLVMGTFFASQMALPLAVSAWWAGQLCLLCLALMFSSLVMLVSIASRGKVNVIVIIAITCFVGGWVIVRFVPGLALLGGAMTGQMLWSFFTGGTKIASGTPVAIAAMVAQLALAMTFLAACFRKVRFPERPLFPVPLAFLLLGFSGAILAGGIELVSELSGLGIPTSGAELARMQLLLSTITFIIVAQFPLIAAAVECFFADRARAFGAAYQVTRRSALLAVPMILAVATVLLVAVLLKQILRQGVTGHGDLSSALHGYRQFAAILIALLTSFWIDFNWIYFAKVRGKSMFWAVALSAIILKAFPIVLDGILIFAAAMRDEDMTLVDGYFSGASPIGTLILCTSEGGWPWPGLLVQIGFAVIATLLGVKARRGIRPAAVHSAHAVQQPGA